MAGPICNSAGLDESDACNQFSIGIHGHDASDGLDDLQGWMKLSWAA